jgi:hypothetical protein
VNPLEHLAIHGLQLPPGRAGLPWAGLTTPFVTPEILSAPIALTNGQVLENRCFVLSPDFAGKPWQSVLYGDHVRDITIRNVALIGWQGPWQTRWNTFRDPAGNGISGGMAGIRIQTCENLTIDRVRVEGFPQAAIYVQGITDSLVRDVAVSRCFQGVTFGGHAPSARVRVERVFARDLWGPGPGHWPSVGGHPSGLRPGGFIGSDAVVGNQIRDFLFLDCVGVGEMYGAFKVAGGTRVEFHGMIGNTLMIDGGTWPSQEVLLRDCVLDKRLAFGDFTTGGQALQVSGSLGSVCRVERCHFIAGAGIGGHGVQVYGPGSQATIVDSMFSGFNGKVGIGVAWAAHTAAGGVLNDDFETVNHFTNQERLWLRG